MKSFRIIENPSELGAGTRGSSLGIEALRIAAINKKSKLFYDNEVVTLPKNNKKLFKEVTMPNAIRLKQIYHRIEVLGEEVNSTINEKKFPLVISGDHSSAAGTIAGLKKSYPNHRIGVIWIDAHPDIHTLSSSKSGNIHCMPLSFITGLENGWKWVNSLKFLKFDDLYYFGIRDIDDFELKVIKYRNIEILKSVSDICDICEKYDNIHISFDVDSIDPFYISSTGTVVEHGIELSEIIFMNHYIKDNIDYKNKTINFDIVEYNPTIGSDFDKSVSKKNIKLIIDSLF